MKYCYLSLSMLFWKIIDAFKPYIMSYSTFFTQNTCSNIIRKFSGLLPKIPSTLFKPSVQVTIIHNDCNIDNKECKNEIVIPGYIDHSPKEAAIKIHNKKSHI